MLQLADAKRQKLFNLLVWVAESSLTRELSVLFLIQKVCLRE